MNKVITINLGGNAYQLEEGGYDALRAYLETAAARLQANPDREEILSDIERAIAEKFRALLASHKNVVETKEVAAVLTEMGPVEVEAGEAASASAGAASGPKEESAKEGGGPNFFNPFHRIFGGYGGPGAAGGGGMHRRLYRIQEGAMFCGVCNGIGAYLNIDPTFVRLAFVLAAIFWGTGVLLYIVLAFVVPEAHSAEEKAAATGSPSTAQEFIRRAKEGYYEAMKGFPDRKSRREWQQRFKRDMRVKSEEWRHEWKGWDWRHGIRPQANFTLPLFSLLHGAVTLLWICVLVSLLASGTLLGLELPASVPVWVAALLLMIVYGSFVWPLKAARHACYQGFGASRSSGSLIFFLDALVWIAIVGALIWLAFHFFPQLDDAVRSVPSLMHQAKVDIKHWWKGR